MRRTFVFVIDIWGTYFVQHWWDIWGNVMYVIVPWWCWGAHVGQCSRCRLRHTAWSTSVVCAPFYPASPDSRQPHTPWSLCSHPVKTKSVVLCMVVILMLWSIKIRCNWCWSEVVSVLFSFSDVLKFYCVFLISHVIMSESVFIWDYNYLCRDNPNQSLPKWQHRHMGGLTCSALVTLG